MGDIEWPADQELEAEGPLGRVAAYRLAVGLGDCVVKDGEVVGSHPLLRDVAPQLVRAVGSIGANIAEGYGRRSRADRIRYFEYALGSVQEARRWYSISRTTLSIELTRERLSTLASIRRLLSAMIRNERAQRTWG